MTSTETAAPVAGNRRWVVAWLLFLAMVINYVDRQMIGFLKPGYLQPELGWSEKDFADIVFWFQAAYAASYLVFGRLVDRIGAKAGFAAAFTIWTLAHMAHGAVRTVMQATLVRAVLGVGEGGAFPAAVKAVTDWFPRKERAFAIGFLTAGNNIGAIVTPLVVPVIVVDLALGWRASFVVVGLATLIWLPLWLLLYKKPRAAGAASEAELALIESDNQAEGERPTWRTLLTRREAWAYAIVKFLIDPIWWFFLFWLPSFLGSRYGLDLKGFGPPIVAIYLLSDLGAVGGGYLSSRLIKSGVSLNAARKITLAICAALVVPVMFAANVGNLWVAVAIIGVATAGHQGFNANMLAMPADVFPRSAVGSVIGFGGMFGGIGGMAFAAYIGQVLETIGSYTPIFIVAGSVYFIALLVLHLLCPKYAPVEMPAAQAARIRS